MFCELSETTKPASRVESSTGVSSRRLESNAVCDKVSDNNATLCGFGRLLSLSESLTLSYSIKF